MEVAVGIAIGVLVVVLLFSAAGIVIAIKTKCCQKPKEDSPQANSDIDIERAVVSPDRQLIEDEGEDDDVSLTLQHVLDDDIWLDDMTGVMTHCIPILKSCHDLTSRLVPVTAQACDSDEDNKKIAAMAVEVQPRLDDVVQLLEGPLDPRLIEARCTSLYYAVSNLCLVIKSICKDADDIAIWIDSSLRDIEGHLKILQAETQKLYRRSVSGSMRGRGGADSSPVYELSLSGTHSNSSSSHTDSAESGIDLQTPSERGSEHSPHSPSYAPVVRDHNKNVDKDKPGKHNGAHRGCTIAEVHVHEGKPSDVIEMSSFSNNGYAVTAE